MVGKGKDTDFQIALASIPAFPTKTESIFAVTVPGSFSTVPEDDMHGVALFEELSF